MSQQQDVSSSGPTVRVMRLYKPGLDLGHTAQPILDIVDYSRSDFAISQYLILPDSFGDIYIGEKFSAYIAVVNGVEEASFTNLTISVKLQTANTAYDLFDVRPGADDVSSQLRTLNPADAADIIVAHELNEVGTHTMRVSISYTDARTNEPKTLRKFYRFNVASALNVDTRCKVLGNKLFVQCCIKNATKTALYITDVRFDSLSEKVKSVKKLSSTNHIKSECSTSNEDDLLASLKCPYNPYLVPDDIYADTFVISLSDVSDAQLSKGFGTVVASWSSSMGENGFVRSEEVHAASFRTERLQNKLAVKLECVSCPVEVNVATPFAVKFRVWNQETFPISAQLQSRASLEDPSGLVLTGLSCMNLGIIEPECNVELLLHVCSLGSGMHEMKSLVIFDSISGKEYNEESSFRVFVQEAT